MRVGIIDLGTNSVRFDIRQISYDSQPKKIFTDKRMVRLGQDLFKSGRLHPDAIRRTLDAFQAFKVYAQIYRVKKIIAFATSAMREARDADLFVETIKKKTGINIEIISGHREAKLIAEGVMLFDPRAKAFDKFALVDIGGGSVEITICENNKIVHSASFDLGVARLNQMFMLNSKVKDPMESLKNHIRETLGSTLKKNKWSKVKRIIGSSGTIKTLIRMGKKGKPFLTRVSLEQLARKMKGLNTSELLNLPGIDPQRLDTIYIGSVLFQEITKSLGASRCYPTEFSLRDGIAANVRQLGDSARVTFKDIDMDSVKDFSIRYTLDSDRVSIIKARRFFLKFARAFQLKKEKLNLFLAFCYLAPTGKSISFDNFESHTEYLIKNSDFLHLTGIEREALAELCLLQNKMNNFKNLSPEMIRLVALHQLFEIVANNDLLKLVLKSRGKTLIASGPGTQAIEKRRKLFESKSLIRIHTIF